MSYILDAIRKSDHERRRGAAPTLQSAPFPPAREEPGFRWIYPVLALGLAAAGFAIGWMRPWHERPEPVAKSPELVAPPRPVPREGPRALPAPKQPRLSLAQAAPVKPAPAPAVAQPQQPAALVAYAELPVSVRQELPSMKVSVHAYSRTPGERLVDVNDRLLHEGDALAPGLVLESITPEGMIFNFRGTRFSRGVQ